MVDGKTEGACLTLVGMAKNSAITVHGYTKPEFTLVRQAFVENFSQRGELGGACCIYYRGEKVVDLWGGIRNKNTGEPWAENTIESILSAPFCNS